MIGYVTQTNELTAPASAYELSAAQLEQEGRWRSVRRSGVAALLLLGLQVPLLATATGRLESQTYVPAVVPARLSLLVDLAMIAAYVMLAYRATELVCSVGRSRGVRITTYVAGGAVAVGAALDLVEDLTLWVRVGPAVTAADMTWWWSWPLRAGLLVSLGVLVHQAVRARKTREEQLEASPAEAATKTAATSPAEGEAAGGEAARPDLVIACSGGGVRSASFCLGGLQQLSKTGHYGRADAVVGVSGGGYMAAAFHAVRWQSTTGTAESPWPAELDRDAFSPSSPEQQWLRRNSRYLMKSTDVVVQALLSLLFGMAINIVLLAAALLSIAWLLGWYVNASGALAGWDTPTSQALDFPSGAWSLAGWVWVVPAAGAALFVVEKLVDRFRPVPFQERQNLRRWTSTLLIGGLVATAALLGIPALLSALHNYTTGSGSAWAQLLQTLGFASKEACTAALASDGSACGVNATGDLAAHPNPLWFSGGSVTALLAAVLAVVRSATAKADGKSGDQQAAWLRKGLAKVWDLTKHVVVPWLAAAVIVAVLAVVLLRSTAALVDTPSKLAAWPLLYTLVPVLALVRLLTDANRTSLHHFYRERLSYAYLVRRRRGAVTPIDYATPLCFSGSEPPPGRGPRLAACAVANVTDADIVPEKRGCTPFVFDDRRIGLTDRLLPTAAATVSSPLYEYAADRFHRDVTIPAAMAMSGAAFSPLAGRMNGRVAPYRFVLALANARLGVWLPNPLWVDGVAVSRRLVKARLADDVVVAWHRLDAEDRRRLWNEMLSLADRTWLLGLLSTTSPADVPDVSAGFSSDRAPGDGHDEGSWPVRLSRGLEAVRNVVAKPGPYRLLKEAVGQTSIYDRSLYITDGGHYDNLGLLEALRRRPKEIIVLDAAADAEDTFDALGMAIATARMDLDCEITFDPRAMKRVSKEARATTAWGKGTYTFADGTTGSIWLAKVVLTDGLPWDVESYAAHNPTFPRTSTGNQLYGEFDLEAYRILGREVTEHMVREIPPDVSPLPDADEEQAPEPGSPPSTPPEGTTAVPPVAPVVGPVVEPTPEPVTLTATWVAIGVALRQGLRDREAHRKARRR